MLSQKRVEAIQMDLLMTFHLDQILSDLLLALARIQDGALGAIDVNRCKLAGVINTQHFGHARLCLARAWAP